jgi:hypothetical protein
MDRGEKLIFCRFLVSKTLYTSNQVNLKIIKKALMIRGETEMIEMIGKLVQTALMGVIEANRAICRVPITKDIMEGAIKGGEAVVPFEPHIPANSDGVCVYINVPFCKSKCTYCYLNTSI